MIDPDLIPIRTPEIEAKFMTVSTPVKQSDSDAEWNWLMDGYGLPAEREDLRFKLKTAIGPEAPWYSPCGRSVSVGMATAAKWLSLMVSHYFVEQGKHPRTGREIEIRRQPAKYSFSGERILPIARIGAWRFFTEYVPDPTQMSDTEWKIYLAAHAELIAHDRNLEEQEAVGAAEIAARRTRAFAAKENPDEYLASAISRGIAAAIASMKGGKA